MSTTAITVSIFGPNLSGPAQAKGYFHVHAADCQDCRHYGPGRKYQGEAGWTIEASSRQAIVEEIYCDMLDENPDSDWRDYDDLHVAPCLEGLPFDDDPQSPPPPAPSGPAPSREFATPPHEGPRLPEEREDDYTLGEVDERSDLAPPPAEERIGSTAEQRARLRRVHSRISALDAERYEALATWSERTNAVGPMGYLEDLARDLREVRGASITAELDRLEAAVELARRGTAPAAGGGPELDDLGPRGYRFRFVRSGVQYASWRYAPSEAKARQAAARMLTKRAATKRDDTMAPRAVRIERRYMIGNRGHYGWELVGEVTPAELQAKADEQQRERDYRNLARQLPAYCRACGGDGTAGSEPGPCEACGGSGVDRGRIPRRPVAGGSPEAPGLDLAALREELVHDLAKARAAAELARRGVPPMAGGSPELGKVHALGMVYLSGAINAHAAAEPGIEFLLTPNTGNRLPAGCAWAADNGCFTKPELYSDERYLSWLVAKTEQAGRPPRWATAPDVVGDAKATLARSAPVLAAIRALGIPAALVAQDGLEDLEVPWSSFDVLFVGGSTEWKMGAAAAQLVREAKARGKLVHAGRVNSAVRMAHFCELGADSADGTYLAFGPVKNLPKVRAWLAASAERRERRAAERELARRGVPAMAGGGPELDDELEARRLARARAEVTPAELMETDAEYRARVARDKLPEVARELGLPGVARVLDDEEADEAWLSDHLHALDRGKARELGRTRDKATRARLELQRERLARLLARYGR